MLSVHIRKFLISVVVSRYRITTARLISVIRKLVVRARARVRVWFNVGVSPRRCENVTMSSMLNFIVLCHLNI